MDLFGEEIVEDAEEETVISEEPVALSPRTAQHCLGHQQQQDNISSLFESGHMPHALVFSGEKGIGKSTLAYILAKKILAHGKDVSPNLIAQRVISGGHPDLLVIERPFDSVKGKQKDSVSVEETRKVAPFLRRTAAEGGWRVVIIDDADTMNRNAQNALLKILEEPPKNVVLILVAHRAGALIPTIRSRSRFIHFDPLDDETIKELLKLHGAEISASQRQILLQLSEGSFGRALQYIEEGGLETLDRILGLMQSYPSWNWPQIYVFADEIGRKGQEDAYRNFRALTQWAMQRLLLTKAKGGSQAAQPLDMDVFTGLLKNSSLESLARTCENLHSHFESVERANLDKRQGVVRAFSLLAA